MILFTYGNDSYLLREKITEWIYQYKAKNKSGLNIYFFSPKTFDMNEFKRTILSVSMFAEKKLAVLEGFCASSQSETLVDFMRDANMKEKKDIFLVFSEHIESSDDKRDVAKREASFEKNKLTVFLKKNAYKTEQTDAPRGARLGAWVQNEFQKRNAHINAQAIAALIVSVPPDMWLLASEIEKLSLYSNTITSKEVALLVTRHISSDVFKTIDALGARNKAAALSMIHEHIVKGDSALELMGMLAFQFRNIYLAKKLDGAPFPKSAGLHPFVQQKAKAQSKNFSLEEISRVYKKLFEADVAIKTGDMQPHTALDMFVANAL